MSRVRATARAGLGLCGAGLIIAAVVLALHDSSELTSVGALLCGVLLVLIAATGQLPDEVGLQRVSFRDQSTEAAAYQEQLLAAVRNSMPVLRPPARTVDAHASQNTYWIERLQLQIVVTWAPDDSYRFDVAVLDPVVEQLPAEGKVLVITNANDVATMQDAMHSRWHIPAVVVNWRSPADNAALRRATRRLSRMRTRRHERKKDAPPRAK